MLRIPIDSVNNSGSYDDDDYYYLMYDPDINEYVVEHRWHHWRPNGVDRGTEVLTIDALKRKSDTAHAKALIEIEQQGRYDQS